MQSFDNLTPYFGDLHSHCAVGYGHGSLDDAFRNARMQLDFAAVTVHAYWHDLPTEEPRLAGVVDYHRMGFERSAKSWSQVKETVAANNVPGEFVSFLAFEWHSRKYGDHNVYYRDGEGEILRADDLPEMRQMLRALQAQGVEALVLPHHIGYRQGYRGINWAEFDPTFSPIVEIMSMHGASESPDAPRPYLHTMGPRDWQSTYQYGLAQGHIVGVMGSTDHHSAHPGSYGHGRVSVWAEELSREALWEGIKARRTVALTGDNIELSFSLNGGPMGSVLPPSRDREITVDVTGGAAIDYVELLHNNRVVERISGWRVNGWAEASQDAAPFAGPLKVHVEVGWGEKGEDVAWQGALSVTGGELLDVEPRFRGQDVVAPQAEEEEAYAFSDWTRTTDGVSFSTHTWGNPTTSTPGTQGLALTLTGTPETRIEGTINGKLVSVTLAELVAGPKAIYLGGFLTPAIYFHQAVAERDYRSKLQFSHQYSHQVDASARDWYHVRVRQLNGHWAWSSPIWVERG